MRKCLGPKDLLTYAIAASAALTATSANARGTVIDFGLLPNLINPSPPQPLNCDSNGCSAILPYKVLVGSRVTDTFYVYDSGILSLGKVLPLEAFSPGHVDGNGDPVSVHDYFAGAGLPVLAPKFVPDGSGSPGGAYRQVSVADVRAFAENNINGCGQGGPGKTVCPPGFEPFVSTVTDADLDAFIALNGLGQFVGDVYAFMGTNSFGGLGGVVAFRAPKNGQVKVELLQFGVPFTGDDNYYTGAFNDIFQNSDAVAARQDYIYTLDLAAVPEPRSWALMISGFALAGAAMRKRRRTSVQSLQA